VADFKNIAAKEIANILTQRSLLKITRYEDARKKLTKKEIIIISSDALTKFLMLFTLPFFWFLCVVKELN
jgi:hypothetical protein